MRGPFGVALILAFALSISKPAPAVAATAGKKSRGSARHYQAGVDYYTEGNLAASLASFREALRLEPNNHSARSAVRRLERESAIRPDAAGFRRLERIAHRAEDGLIDRFFLISLPRWFYFERTFGDGLRDAGTMAAVNARVVQLLGERRVAFARNRPFAKDRLLRELLRRAPAAAGAFEEV